MSDIILENTPKKQCTACLNWFDATSKHFYRQKRGSGLRAKCKICNDQGKKSSLQSTIDLVCSRCGKEFTRHMSDYLEAQKRVRNETPMVIYCSNACRYIYVEQVPDSIIAEEYQTGVSCSVIAKRHNVSYGYIRVRLMQMGIEIRPSTVYTKASGGPMKGKNHTDETKAMLSAKAKEQFNAPGAREQMAHITASRIANGEFARVSKLEDRVADDLTRRGVIFKRQCLIHAKGYKGSIGCVDFKLNDGRVIEVNGTFWHVDSRKYPDGPIHPAQSRTVERYNKKIAILAELGIPLIELWEMDLEADLAGTIDKALHTRTE